MFTTTCTHGLLSCLVTAVHLHRVTPWLRHVDKGVMYALLCFICHLLLSTEMNLHSGDVWGHFAPMFHLVDVFAVTAITLLGGRHVTLPVFRPLDALLAIGTCIDRHTHTHMQECTDT